MLKTFLDKRREDNHLGPTAAVAAVLRLGEKGPEVLFIERAIKDGDPWSGQMAFPGGRTELKDKSSLDTARRETLEEIGFDLNQTMLLGCLSDQEGGPKGSSQKLLVTPYLYWYEQQDFTTSLNHEVAAIVWVPVENLFDRSRHIQYAYPPLGNQLWPGIQIDSERVVWGLTLRMVEDLFERVGFPLKLR